MTCIVVPTAVNFFVGFVKTCKCQHYKFHFFETCYFFIQISLSDRMLIINYPLEAIQVVTVLSLALAMYGKVVLTYFF